MELYVPRFSHEAQFSLTGALMAMGMPEAFNISADFSGIGIAELGLYIRDVLQGVFLEMDEKGTEAAAATAIRMFALGDPIEVIQFRVDRPYIFAIVDSRTALPLFMGAVNDPRKPRR